MVKRKVRARKGVDSLTKQIEIHKQKLEKAREEGKLELADYYVDEIKSLEEAKEKKERLLLPRKQRIKLE
ncbi:MAG: hypothetical protein ABIB47_01810 [Candidatus Woesearchaeota archaeon]